MYIKKLKWQLLFYKIPNGQPKIAFQTYIMFGGGRFIMLRFYFGMNIYTKNALY